MSLYKEVEELEKQIEEEEQEDQKDEDQDQEDNEEDAKGDEQDSQDEDESDSDEEKNDDDDDKGGDKEDSKSDDEEEDVDLDDEKKRKQAFAKMRRDKAALKRKLEEKEQAKEQPKKEEAKAPEEPEKYTEDGNITREWFEWNNERVNEKIEGVSKEVEATRANEQQQELIRGAVKELQEYEEEFAHEVDDFKEVSLAYKEHMERSIKTLNPSATPQQVQSLLASHILKTAGQFVTDGKDPAEEMYYMAKEMVGEVKKSAKKDDKPDEMKNTKTAAKNRRRSGTPLKKGRGESGARYTAEQLDSMSPAELQRLSPAEIQELENETQIM